MKVVGDFHDMVLEDTADVLRIGYPFLLSQDNDCLEYRIRNAGRK